jgi:hypothetical protein
MSWPASTKWSVFSGKAVWASSSPRATCSLINSLLRNRAFVIEYAIARDQWQNGMAAVFPPRTYWLQRFASVPVLET